MFERLLDRLRAEAGGALRLLAVGAALVMTAAIAFGFLCAAGFVAALDALGLFYACLVAAGFFVLVTLVLLAAYAVVAARRRRAVQRRPQPAPLSFADPRLMQVGLQVVQAIGVRRLLPILAVSGAAFVLAARAGRGASADKDEARGR